jgi:hypothetical protein
LFPVVLDDLVPDDHVCWVIDAFVARLEMNALGFERFEPAETARPGYDPRDLLKLYLYGYLQQICKRPEFPSGMGLGASRTMPSWVLQRKQVGYGRSAGGGRYRRSGA